MAIRVCCVRTLEVFLSRTPVGRLGTWFPAHSGASDVITFLISCFSFSYPYSRCVERLTRCSMNWRFLKWGWVGICNFHLLIWRVERHDEMSEKLYSAFGIGLCVWDYCRINAPDARKEQVETHMEMQNLKLWAWTGCSSSNGIHISILRTLHPRAFPSYRPKGQRFPDQSYRWKALSERCKSRKLAPEILSGRSTFFACDVIGALQSMAQL